MAELIVNLPPKEVWVRKEYLTDHSEGHGQFVKGLWCTLKSIRGRAFTVETYLPEYNALYDKLPLSAFVTSPKIPEPDLPLHELQFWDCFSPFITIIRKDLLSCTIVSVRTKEYKVLQGEYLFTVDSYHGDRHAIDTGFSEIPAEHKSFNFVELANGQIAAYPNNRLLFTDNSLSHETAKTPFFKACTKVYSVEGKTSVVYGDNESFHY